MLISTHRSLPSSWPIRYVPCIDFLIILYTLSYVYHVPHFNGYCAFLTFQDDYHLSSDREIPQEPVIAENELPLPPCLVRVQLLPQPPPPQLALPHLRQQNDDEDEMVTYGNTWKTPQVRHVGNVICVCFSQVHGWWWGWAGVLRGGGQRRTRTRRTKRTRRTLRELRKGFHTFPFWALNVLQKWKWSPFP